MAVEWHYSRNREKYGPVSSAKLKELADTGQLQPDDLVWRHGMSEWALARKVKGLFSESSIPPPPPRPPRTEVPVRVVVPSESRMAKVAKWVVIGWSLFCLLGIIVGLVNAGSSLDRSYGDTESAGAAIGIGCGMGIYLVIWAAIAGPALLIWLLSRK